jgi:hypothetical protein
MKNAEEHLAKLVQQKERAKKKLEVFRYQQSVKGRKEHSFRMFLIGQAVTSAVEARAMRKTTLDKLLDKFTTKNRERVFLGLEPLPEPPHVKTDNDEVLAALKRYAAPSKEDGEQKDESAEPST